MFWDAHSPTSPSFSRQYRSAIFPEDDTQRAAAEASLASEQKERGRRLHTAIEDATTFWSAEDYHQKYSLRGNTDVMAAIAARYPDGSWVDSTAAARLNGILGGYTWSGDLADLGLDGRVLRQVEARR